MHWSQSFVFNCNIAYGCDSISVVFVLDPLFLCCFVFGRNKKTINNCFVVVQDAFCGMDIDADEDVEISKMVEDYKKRGGHVEGKVVGLYRVEQIYFFFLYSFSHFRIKICM